MDSVLLFLLLALFIILAAVNARRIVFFSVAAMLLVIPISNAAFMPRSVFGIAGLNLANIVWLFVFVLVSFSIIHKKGTLRFQSYMSLPLTLFVILYLLAAVWTFIDVGSIEYPITQINRISILLENIIKPIQYFLSGWIVMVGCELEGDRRSIQKVIYFVPFILAPVQLYYFFIGGSSGVEYSEGRDTISASIGYHANELGAVGSYLLAIILLIREDSWRLIRYLAIGASLIVVAVSFSRMAYVTTVILFSIIFLKSSAKERMAIGLMAAVVVLIFSAQLVNRINFGVEQQSKETDINLVSANRIEGIWKPLMPHMVENIVFGSGVYGLLKHGEVSRGMPTHPHNAYFQVVLDIGLIGIFSLAWMLLKFRREDKKTDGTFKYLVMAWMLMGLTGHTFYPSFANFLVWVGYGLMLAARKEKRALPKVAEETDSLSSNAARLLQAKI